MNHRLTHHQMAVLAAALLWTVTSGSACTVCNSEAAQQVRSGIFGPDFGLTLLWVIAPFPVLLLAVRLIQHSLFDKHEHD